MAADLLTIFLDYALAAGAVATRASGITAAADAIRAATPERLRVSAAVFRRFPDLAGALHDLAPVEIDDTPVEVADRCGLAEEIAGGTAVLLARAGVAETGSVLLADNALAIRLLGMLSETCVVLLSAGDILPDLDAVGALIARLEREGQRYCSLVTGPSRTADIERVLTIGVHGPRALHVVVLDSPHD